MAHPHGEPHDDEPCDHQGSVEHMAREVVVDTELAEVQLPPDRVGCRDDRKQCARSDHAHHQERKVARGHRRERSRDRSSKPLASGGCGHPRHGGAPRNVGERGAEGGGGHRLATSIGDTDDLICRCASPKPAVIRSVSGCPLPPGSATAKGHLVHVSPGLRACCAGFRRMPLGGSIAASAFLRSRGGAPGIVARSALDTAGDPRRVCESKGPMVGMIPSRRPSSEWPPGRQSPGNRIFENYAFSNALCRSVSAPQKRRASLCGVSPLRGM